MFNSRIIGLGHYVPDNIVTNDDLSKFMDTTDDWIQERTGIKKRRWIDPKSGDTTSTMGAKASEIAIPSFPNASAACAKSASLFNNN